ncbi:unnamed protein product, partial [marine sediment metagenome]
LYPYVSKNAVLIKIGKIKMIKQVNKTLILINK